MFDVGAIVIVKLGQYAGKTGEVLSGNSTVRVALFNGPTAIFWHEDLATTFDMQRDALAARIEERYAAWEEGRDFSPDTTDFVYDASEIVFRNRFAFSEARRQVIATSLWELQNGGELCQTPLEMASWLIRRLEMEV